MKKSINKNYPIQIRYKTLKEYQDNYKNDLSKFLKEYVDNAEIDFLEIDLESHKSFLKHLLTKSPIPFLDDSEAINQEKINSQKRIIEFIKGKISAFKTIEKKEMMVPIEIDFSDLSATKKTIYLNELGIIDYLRKQPCFAMSVNNLAAVVSAVTGEKQVTIQPYLNAMLSDTEAKNKNPYSSKSSVEQVKNHLIKLGFKLR